MTPYILVWAAIAVVVLILAGWRQVIHMHEDNTIHLHDSDTGLVQAQVDLEKKVRIIDRVGQVLTVIVALYGLGLVAFVLSQQWAESGKL
jgi:hypothetical protein